MVVASPTRRLLHDNWIRRERFISPLYGGSREDSWQKFAVVCVKVAQKAKASTGVPQWWRGRTRSRFRDSTSGDGVRAAASRGAAVTPSTPKCPANPLIQLRLGIICRSSPMMAEAAGETCSLTALIRIECSPTHNKTAGKKRHLNAQISSFFFSTPRLQSQFGRRCCASSFQTSKALSLKVITAHGVLCDYKNCAWLILMIEFYC
jgi:hypothetical protein